jgi:hypothetical protein
MNIVTFDVNRSLLELDTKSKISIVARADKMRRKRVKDLTVQELRMMIHQNSSIKFLVPLAIERLQINSLLQGEGYEGDLLNAVLTVEKKFWLEDLKAYIPLMEGLIKTALALANEKPAQYKKFLDHCGGAINIFKSNVGIA